MFLPFRVSHSIYIHIWYLQGDKPFILHVSAAFSLNKYVLDSHQWKLFNSVIPLSVPHVCYIYNIGLLTVNIEFMCGSAHNSWKDSLKARLSPVSIFTVNPLILYM